MTGMDAVIDFGSLSSSNTLRFSNGTVSGWTGNLIIRNFKPASDKLFFGTSATGVNGNLSKIKLVNPIGYAAGSYNLLIDSSGSVGLAPPSVATGLADGITATAATLSGTVNGFATTALFEYGPTTSYGATKTVTLPSNNGATATSVTADISGLEPGSVYHYRLTATNSLGTSTGADQTFTTYTAVPFTYYDAVGVGRVILSYTGIGGAVAIPSTIYGIQVNSIGDHTFSGCTGLTSVSIPASVTSIGVAAFESCTGLTSVDIPSSVTSIGAYAFSGCTDLTSAIISNGFASIEEGTFYRCTALTSVSIPASVTSIGIFAFAGCSSLASINVDTVNSMYSSLDGVLFNQDKTTLVQYPGGKPGPYTIPTSVTSIGEGAFDGCALLSNVTIPTSVTSIGDYAFADCSQLNSVTLPSSVTSIGDFTFSGSATLTSVTIPASVTSIGDFAFDGCTSLTSVTIPSSVTSIGKGAFSGCTNLVSVTIPSSVSSIGQEAFEGCTALTSVVLPANLAEISGSLFAGCTGLTSFAVPASATRIGDYAFFGCTGLTGISIPASVTSIGKGSFSGCIGLASVTIPSGVTTIEEAVFEGCSGLTNETLPASVTHIKEAAFADCTGLTGISLPASLTSFGSRAFAGCTSLTSVAIPAGIVTLASYLFDGCTNLTNVTLPDSLTTVDDFSFIGCTRLASLALPASVTSIGASAFSGCTSITGMILPAGVTSIGSAAFSGCTSLASMIIPSGVHAIGYAIFYGCVGLTSITIPASVTSIGSDSFAGCTGLTSVTLPTSVTSIGNLAFSGCTGLTNMTIPASVTSIGDLAFDGCTALTHLAVDVSNTAFCSVDGVLFNQTQTTLIQCPAGRTGSCSIPASVTSIRGTAFSGCLGLTAITVAADNSQYSSVDGVLFNLDETILIRFPQGKTGSYSVPPGVTTIADGAFANCHGLTSVTIPTSVTSMGNAAFSGCSKLTAITVITGNLAFSSLDGVLFNQANTALIQFPRGKTGTYNIPSNITRIDSWAFADCTGLVSVAIPASVNHLGYFAFSGCTSLTRAVFQGNAPIMDYGVFDSTAASFTVYYFNGLTGFSSPTWQGYPAVNLGSPAPVVTTGPASGITTSAATLHGTVNPHGFATTARFEYGPTTAYGSTASVTLSPADGTAAQNVSVNVTGLQLGQTYHYRLTATNSEGTSPGEDLTFATTVPYTYATAGGAVTITGYTGSGGEVNIPGMIYGLPVTRIGSFAFHNHSGVNCVTLPASVAVIEDLAFASCGNLVAFTLPVGLTEIGNFAFYECGNLASLTLPASVISIGNYAFAECAKLTRITLNYGLTTIGAGAFYSCDALAHGTIPSSVTGIGESAFQNCTRLANATFMGNAPAIGDLVFDATAAGFTVYHFDGATGFASPTWLGYPTLSMGAAKPVVIWLIDQSLPYNANLQEDANGDGVNLLLAYALDLNPQQDLSGRLPQPVIAATGLSLTFHAGAADVIYGVESSNDLQTWSAADVTLSVPDAENNRTATVPMNVPRRYLRLVVRVP